MLGSHLQRQIKKLSPACALSCGSLKLYCIFLLFVIVLRLANLIFGLPLKLSSLRVSLDGFFPFLEKIEKQLPTLLLTTCLAVNRQSYKIACEQSGSLIS